jgi:hypothetical protein
LIGVAQARDGTNPRRCQPARPARTVRRLFAALLGLLLLTGMGYAVYLRLLVTTDVRTADLLPGGPVPTDAGQARAGAAHMGDDYPASSLLWVLPGLQA